MTLSAGNNHPSCKETNLGTYLSEKFLEHPDDEVCTEVNNKLHEYMSAMDGLCEEDGSQLMCKSLVNMFKVDFSNFYRRLILGASQR